MTEFLQLILVLSIIIVAAKAAGYLSAMIGQPSVLGELLAGILLGPSLVNLFGWSFFTSGHLGETVFELGELGVLLLMFLAGLELHISDLRDNAKAALYAGTLGVVFPVLFGYLIGHYSHLDNDAALFLGLTLGATSVSISAQTLMELKQLRSRAGLGLLGAAVVDDVLVILLLSIVLAVLSGAGGFVQIILVFVKMIAYLGLSAAFGYYLLPKISAAVRQLSISKGVMALALVIMFVYGLAAELLGGMAAITGTFLAGLMFSRTREKQLVETDIHAIAYGLFVPIFFITIGLQINIHDLETGDLLLLLIIILAAIFGKFIGAGLGAYFGGYSKKESVQLGVGMISRGEVGLIVAQVGVSAGLLAEKAFALIVGMVLATTIITPILLKLAFKEPAGKLTENSG